MARLIGINDLIDDFKKIYDQGSNTLNEFMDIIFEISKIKIDKIDVDSLNKIEDKFYSSGMVERLTKEDIQYLEKICKKKFDKEYIYSECTKYIGKLIKKVEKKDKISERKNRNSSSVSRKNNTKRRQELDISFDDDFTFEEKKDSEIDFDDKRDSSLHASFSKKEVKKKNKISLPFFRNKDRTRLEQDNPFDDDFTLDEKKDSEIDFDDDWENVLGVSYTKNVTLEDLYYFERNDTKTLANFYEAVKQIDMEIDEFDKKDFLTELDKLTMEDIKIIEELYKKRFDKKALEKEYFEYIKRKKRKENRFDLTKLFNRSKKNNSSIRKRNEDVDFEMDLEQEETLTDDHDFEFDEDFSKNGVGSKSNLETKKVIVGNEDSNLANMQPSYVITGEILSVAEVICGKDIVQQFKETLFNIMRSSDSEKYILKSNLLINEMLASITYNEKEVVKKMKDYFWIDFPSDKVATDVINELIGDELRFYQQELLSKKKNINNDLGNARLIRRTFINGENVVNEILFATLNETKKASYKFNMKLLDQYKFTISSMNGNVLNEDMIKYRLMKDLFDAGEYDLDVIASYNGQFVIVTSDYWFMDKTRS